MSVWDELAPVARDSGALGGLQQLLQDINVTTTVDVLPGPPPQKRIRGTWAPTAGRGLRFDPGAGSFVLGSAAETTDPRQTPIEFPDPTVSFELLLDLDAPGGDPTGPVQLKLTVPSAIALLPFLRGAKLDAQGMLEEDRERPDVRFHLPRLTIESAWSPTAGMSVRLASASTAPPGGTDPADIYEFVRMEPPYALAGPGDVIGFGFRTAALDLSGTSNPPGAARAMPLDWQGFWLPEARLFVAPSGMEGLAVNAGVRDLWIGLGAHAGVTGVFEAEVVNRGGDPQLRVRFQDAAGRWYDGSGPAVALPEHTTLFVDAGGGLAPYDYAITVGGTTTNADRVAVTTPATGSMAIEVAVTDAASHTSTVALAATRRTTPGLPPGSAGVQEVTADTSTTTGSRIVIVSQTASDAVVRLEPEGGALAWSWDGGGSATGDTATIPVPSGAADTTVAVTATRTRAAGSTTELPGYFIVDHPRPAEDGLPPNQHFSYTANPDNTRTRKAFPNGTFEPGAEPFIGGPNRTRLTALPAGTSFVVNGFASYDGDNSAGAIAYNRALSERRRDGLAHVLRAMVPGTTVSEGSADGHAAHLGAGGDAAQRNAFWRATAVATVPRPTETVQATRLRNTAPPTTPPADVDPEPTRPPVPDCFRKIGARVEIVRNTFVRAEVYGEFDVRTAAEQRLAANSAGTIPPRTNPSDGICVFLVRLRIDEQRTAWSAAAEFRAIEADQDGLAKLERPTAGATAGTDVIGAVAALAPLLATATPPSPTEGELVALSVATGAVIGLAGAGVISTKYVVLRGGELVVADGPDGTQVTLLLDVETAVYFDAVLVRVQPDKPVVARYKAVGLRSTWNTRTTGGGVEYVPLWAFDPTRGYDLDVPAGALVAREPFGEILRALGFRVSRDNPAYLEVEVGIGVDLGIVDIDTVRVRVRLDAVETPQITAFGATIDVPGVLHGSGYLSLPPGGGLEGAFDLTVVPLNIRAGAALKIAEKNGVTGVFVGLEVEFPVPIVLGNSGLGIFGVLGGVGVNFQRLEPTGVPVPALRWLRDQMARPLGVLNPQGWGPEPGSYAFAAGILLGTLEGGFVVHLKGIVILELPGPRLLLVMKADVLTVPPALRGSQTATFLAVLDMDFARGTITVGLVAEYSVIELLSVRVPVTAFFDTDNVPDWFVDLGSFTEPVTVRVFEFIEGTGYVMVHGNGIAHPRLPMVMTSGLTVAAGFHVQFVWGSTSAGLYLKIAGGFDAVVSFRPFALGGIIEISGELRLFIVSIGASARLTVLAGRGLVGSTEVERTYIHGEVCGEVDFFFFSVRGCVGFELGDSDIPDPVPPPLVTGVSLVSRSPALVEGTATDRAVDAKLGDARVIGDPDGVDPDPVPLDAIPVVLFDVPASTAPGLTVFGRSILGSNGQGADPWIRRGRRWWRYQITAVELVGSLSGGEKPSVWWARGNPGDAQHGPALALLSWLPEPHPRAVPYGERLITTVTEQWGRVCDPAARPAPVLWTFNEQPNGPSARGWSLDGTPWPDDQDTVRSTTLSVRLRVTERWRCGIEQADRLRGIDPARVIGDAVPCPHRQPAEPTLEGWATGQPLDFSRRAGLDDATALVAWSQAIADGTSIHDLRARHVTHGWDPELTRGKLDCVGKLLRSPTGDGVEPIVAGDPVDEKSVREAWERARFTPGELVDAVWLTGASALNDCTVLTLLPRRFLEKMLVVRFLDDAGNVIGEQRVGQDELVHGGNPLPGRWSDPAGPWAERVERAGRIAARIAAREKGLVLALIRCDLPRDTVTVEIGWDPRLVRGRAPAFSVVAVEGLLADEVYRYEWDDSTVSSRREALTAALTEDPDNHALLAPGEDYTVRVRWRAAGVQQDDVPAPTPDPAWGAEQTQEFTFRAQGNADAPTRLEPWLLATTPGPGDVAVFCDEVVRLAFSSSAVDELFAAYGHELRVTVRSASGRHPAPPGGGSPGPFVLDFAATRPTTGPAIYSPWEEAVREVATGGCLPEFGERVDHRVIDLPYAFEPCTDYLLDIDRVPTGSPGSTSGLRIFRIGFTTSRFRSLAEYAGLFTAAPVEHRLVHDPAPLAGLQERPVGAALDQAFSGAGLGIPEVPRYPRVQVLWNGDATPAPVAVVIESNEPMWRSRPMPTVVDGPVDAVDPAHKWWAARPADWLEPAPAAEPGTAPVTRIVRGPGDTRAVVLLGPGARGTELRLRLRRRTDPLAGVPDELADAVRVLLRAAPWEES